MLSALAFLHDLAYADDEEEEDGEETEVEEDEVEDEGKIIKRWWFLSLPTEGVVLLMTRTWKSSMTR